jgi:penicillin-binding protein 1A
MGSGETGGAAALPIWIGYMQNALKNVPETWNEPPPGLITITAGDPASGKTGKDMAYQESVPPVPAEEEPPVDETQQAPAPVVDVKPQPVDKMAPGSAPKAGNPENKKN